ncbi:MAG: hypothetical protein M1825_001738 [Sarcosagium campestre]|nr:MAG: hypothetical protein M1825_001738 [Sarcosagium campestre]
MDWNFSNKERGAEGPTADFINNVGELVSEHHDGLDQVWEAACTETWAASLRKFSPRQPAICEHGLVEDDNVSASNAMMSRQPIDTQGDSSSGADSAFNLDTFDTISSTNPDGTVNIESSSKHESSRSPRSAPGIGERICQECSGNNPASFPYVSDAAPLAILMFLEALHNHKELSFTPMIPAHTSARPEYLSSGNSFKVTRVPWQQVRADTGGRVLTDAVYKRLNRRGSRSALLGFMKDLVVTHHMTYHVSASHKRNIVSLLALGFETVSDGIDEDPALAPVIALEYAPFGTLADLYSSSSFLTSYQKKLWILSDIADGLQALHLSNVVHGDVKPDNVLIFPDRDRGMKAKISDFGLSIIDPGAGPEFQTLPGLTSVYAAPEAGRPPEAGRHATPGRPIRRDRLQYTDVYSFGVVIWQTLLGGTMPFFVPRSPGRLPLVYKEVYNLKTGQNQEVAGLYGIEISEEGFWRLNQAGQSGAEDQEPPDDTVNALLLAMAWDTLKPMTNPAGDSLTIPRTEIPVLLSALQIALSSRPFDRSLQTIRILLGQANKKELVSISKITWESKVSQALNTSVNFSEATPRARELYSSVFENFFVILQRNAKSMDLAELGRLDAILARHLSYVLLQYNLFRFLSGDRSAKTRESMLQYLALASSAGSVTVCAASLSVHQLLGAQMDRPLFFAMGSAMALLDEDVTLSWYEYEMQFDFHAQVKKGRMQSSQKKCFDAEQNRVAAHVLHEQDVGPVDVNYQNADGDTLLHFFTRSGAEFLAFNLLQNHGASASVKNKLGEEAIHWLHRCRPRFVEKMAMMLQEAGANIEAKAPARVSNPDTMLASITSGRAFSTPLLRAIQARNVAAVAALVKCKAEVGSGSETSYGSFELCPVAVAAAMLEHECLEVLLPPWRPNYSSDPDQSEIRYLWELAISGLNRLDLIKFHGDQYSVRIWHTVKVLVEHIGPCYLVRNQRSSLDYIVDGGDLAWVEAIVETHHPDPARAILAELQLGLGRAIYHGHREIAKTIKSFGALPLLPEKWATSPFASGRPGPWSSNLIARLNKETWKAGGSVYKTQCCLHFCATAGTDSIPEASDILTNPVLNPCMKPDLSKPIDPMLDMYSLVRDGVWTQARLDRLDEDGNTPLYLALAQGEFELAQFFVEHGASGHGDGWSIPAQLFEDARPILGAQIEFLLKKCGRSMRGPLERRVFDRLHVQPHDMLNKETDVIRWPTESQTILIAIANVCPQLDDTEKSRLWSHVLPLFSGASSLLARSEGALGGSGNDALGIAIENADLVSVSAILASLKKACVFPGYSAIDQARNLLLDEAPGRIADNPIKTLILTYRRNLGEIIQLLRGAGDKCRTERSDIPSKILERLDSEFHILVTRYKQRGISNAGPRDEFKQETMSLCNAMLKSLQGYPHAASWGKVTRDLEGGIAELLSAFFNTKLKTVEANGMRYASLTLEFLPHGTPVVTTKGYGKSAQQGPDALTLLNWELYRKIRLIETIVGESPRAVLPKLTELEIASLASLGFVNKASRVGIPSSDLLTSRVLELGYASRETYHKPIVYRPNPRYYARPYPSRYSPIAAAMQSERSKRLFIDVLRQRVPSTKSVPEERTVVDIQELLLSHVDDLINLGDAVHPDRSMRHPLFGRIRTNNGYMDLPIEAYIEGSRRLRNRWAAEYERVGMELPDELKELRLDNSDNEESSG